MMERSRYWSVFCNFCEKKWYLLGPPGPHHIFRCHECVRGGKDSRSLKPSPRPNSDVFVAQRDQNVPKVSGADNE
jgi:hypothetical protein